MKTATTKPTDEGKPYVITLHPDDYDCINCIKQSYGLTRVSDCVRLALRETVKQIEQSQQKA